MLALVGWLAGGGLRFAPALRPAGKEETMMIHIITILALLFAAWAYIADDVESAILLVLLCILSQVIQIERKR